MSFTLTSDGVQQVFFHPVADFYPLIILVLNEEKINNTDSSPLRQN